MRNEFYFCLDIIRKDEWRIFLEQERDLLLRVNDDFKSRYKKIEGYGWNVSFGFNPDGNAFLIDENGVVHEGIWFEKTKERIGIFQ
jgi:hypothetical protein